MYQISNAMYEDMAKSITEQIGHTSYFSGVVEFTHIDEELGEVECRIATSLIVYHLPISAPEGIFQSISNIVPVWIECYTYVEKEEIINDFDIERVKEHVCIW